ncbi:Elongator complex protein 4 [Trinorchestia longiramus]|nr:Elongator complex protein 4 [Trinorchestia longiramus]
MSAAGFEPRSFRSQADSLTSRPSGVGQSVTAASEISCEYSLFTEKSKKASSHPNLFIINVECQCAEQLKLLPHTTDLLQLQSCLQEILLVKIYSKRRAVVSHETQLLVSSGIPSLDDVLGGGVPVGTVLLLEEDENNVYAEYFMKCFLAEGVTVGHEVFVASVDRDPVKLMKDLPAPVEALEKEEQTVHNENMKIAWRYENQRILGPSDNSRSLGHHFDLKCPIPDDLLKNCKTYYWAGENCDSKCKTSAKTIYRDLFKEIHSVLTQRKIYTQMASDQSNIMRIGVFSFASFSWSDDLCDSLNTSSSAWPEVTSSFALLRAMARQSYSVIFVSVPSHLFADTALLGRLSYHADYVIGLESFQGTDKEVNPLFKDYHGLLNIYKISSINSQVPPNVDTQDWVFRLKRKRICVEKMHLPPDFTETASRSQGDPVKGAAACGGGLPNKLDF